MPYSLVTPHYPPVCRPVLLLPTVLGRVLDKKLASWQGFQLCTPGEDRARGVCVLVLTRVTRTQTPAAAAVLRVPALSKALLTLVTSCVPPEALSPSDHAAQLQRSEVLEEFGQGGNHCYTLKSVQQVMSKVGTPAS